MEDFKINKDAITPPSSKNFVLMGFVLVALFWGLLVSSMAMIHWSWLFFTGDSLLQFNEGNTSIEATIFWGAIWPVMVFGIIRQIRYMFFSNEHNN